MKTKLTLGLIILSAMSSCKKDDLQPTTPKECVVTPIAEIGTFYQGGIVCYLDKTQQHGYVMAESDQSAGSQWCIDVDGRITAGFTSSEDYGYGASNTRGIVDNFGPGNYAAYLCDTLSLNGYTDWFLPSKFELLTVLRMHPNHGIHTTDSYFSSTESNGSAWYQKQGGLCLPANKYTLNRVRAIRMF